MVDEAVCAKIIGKVGLVRGLSIKQGDALSASRTSASGSAAVLAVMCLVIWQRKTVRCQANFIAEIELDLTAA